MLNSAFVCYKLHLLYLIDIKWQDMFVENKKSYILYIDKKP